MSALRWVLRLGRSGRGQFVLAAVLGTLATASVVGLSAVAAWLIVRANEHPPVLHLMVGVTAVRAFGAGRGILRYGERLAGHDASFRTLGDLRVAVVSRLATALPPGRRAVRVPPPTGHLLGRFVDDVDGLQDLWVRVLLPVIAAVAVSAATVLLVGVLLPVAGVVLALTLVVAGVIAPAVAIVVARGADRRLAPLRHAARTDLLEVLEASTELSVYGALPERLAELDRLDAAATAAQRRSAWAAGAGAAVATLAAGAATWSALWLGADAVDRGALTDVALGVIVLTPLAIHEVVAALSPAAQIVPALAGSAERVREVMELPDSVDEPAAPHALPAGPLGLRLVEVTAQWADDGPVVLDRASLELPAGSLTVIVGPSGVGKSTVANLLLRLLDPVSGSIELVGPHEAVRYNELLSDDVRTVVGWCAQDAYLFDSTIAANLRIARPDATDQELHAALSRARLDDWVQSLSRGLETMVGEHGREISGGQRQRLALARVLLADRDIVVFDEPTEHLDEPTAAALANDLVAASRDRTAVIVTHRPELFAASSPRVVELSAGHFHLH